MIKRIKNIFKQKKSNPQEPVQIPSILNEQVDLDKKLVFSLAKQRFPSWQQLQYLPQYLSKKEKIIIRTLIVLTIICVGFLIFNFYQRHVIYMPRQGGTYSEALVGQPTYINPILAQNDVDRDITRLTYSGLFKYNEHLELEPDIATHYELSEDKKTYTIHLRQNVKWHNENSLIADDVIFTFETIKDTDFNSPYYSSFKGVSLERIDDYTVSFTLEEPFSPFLSNLTIGILPGHIWGDVAASNFKLAEYNTRPIGSGPFQFKELTKDQSGNIKSYVLETNPNFYNNPPYTEKIIFKLYADFESALNALQNNSVDGINFIPQDYRDSLAKNKDITSYSLQLPQYTAVFFNQKNSLLKDKELKQALAFATDKQRILEEALQDQGQIIQAPILEGFLGYHPEVQVYEYNIEKAAQMLDEQGWEVPEDGGLRKKGDQELAFSLTTVDQVEYLKTANILKEGWESINIGIELKIMNPMRVNKEIIKPRNYEAFLYGEILGSDPDPYPFWHSSQSLAGGLNLSNYYNKDVDQLLEQARQIDNRDERILKYVHFQNILADEMPAIFLYSPSYYYGVTKDVKGIELTRITIPSDRFNGVENWYIKTKLGWE
ncbi:hypothetical protein KKF61_04365 [Patescibacteria group bacterium]|nr:hypothetical protein [Patescibacteria group bacterium]MBU0963590.1 hypothetical protein [Patescibacteria group bacterium]